MNILLPKALRLHKLDYQERDRIVDRIGKENLTPEGYYFLLVISVVITMLGLLLDSGAVIIGGMIIAPLLNPIIAIGAAIITGNEKLLFKAIRIVVMSIAVAVVGAVLLTLIVPLRDATQEILVRTKPNLLDLVVALASGAAGAYAVTVRQGLVSLMGVAVAAALMPPLAIIGYGVATWSPDTIIGAFLLFSANLLAVVVATVILFYSLGFGPGRKTETKQVAKRDFMISIVLFLVISIILGGFLVSSMKEARRTKAIEDELRLFLKPYDNTKVISLEEHENVLGTVLEITIQSPSEFNERRTSLLDQRLEERLGEQIDLQLLVIPVTKFIDG